MNLKIRAAAVSALALTACLTAACAVKNVTQSQSDKPDYYIRDQAQGAEYILRWLPRGTHDWEKFVTPDELEAAIAAGGFAPFSRQGVAYNPLADRWSLSADMDVNYMLAARAAA